MREPAPQKGTTSFRFVVSHNAGEDIAGLLDRLLRDIGTPRLTELLAEAVHTRADHFAMAGRVDDELVLRRYAKVIVKAARDLKAATSTGTP